MGLTLIAIGLIFLFNPNFNIIDVIPDAIGMLLVCVGLAKFSRINEDIRKARGLFLWLTGVEFLKLLALGLISSQDPTRYLLLSFSFGVAECLLFIYGVISMFTGFEWLGVKYNSTYILNTYNSGKSPKATVAKDNITRVKNAFISFYIVRTLAATLPEFTRIMKEDLVVDYTKFTPVLYIFGAIITLVFSVVYLVKMLSFFRGIAKDVAFIAEIQKIHSEFMVKNMEFNRAGKMRVVLLLYSLAVVAVINPTDDGLIKIPLIISALLLISASVVLALVNKKALFTIIPALPLCVISVINYNNKTAFYGKLETKFKDIFFITDAAERYAPVSNMTLIEHALIIASFAVFIYVLCVSIKSHIDSAVEINVLNSERKETVRKEFNDSCTKLIKLQIVFSAITLAMNLVLCKLAVILGELSAYTAEGVLDVAGMAFQWLVVAMVIVNVVWFIQARRLANFAKENIYPISYN